MVSNRNLLFQGAPIFTGYVRFREDNFPFVFRKFLNIPPVSYSMMQVMVPKSFRHGVGQWFWGGSTKVLVIQNFGKKCFIMALDYWTWDWSWFYFHFYMYILCSHKSTCIYCNVICIRNASVWNGRTFPQICLEIHYARLGTSWFASTGVFPFASTVLQISCWSKVNILKLSHITFSTAITPWKFSELPLKKFTWTQKERIVFQPSWFQGLC